ncbi:hypothetical protein SNARM312S_07534 [Streptomyces narbonensis]
MGPARGRPRPARLLPRPGRRHERHRQVDAAPAGRRDRRPERGPDHRPPAPHGVRPRALPGGPALHGHRLPGPPGPRPGPRQGDGQGAGGRVAGALRGRRARPDGTGGALQGHEPEGRRRPGAARRSRPASSSSTRHGPASTPRHAASSTAPSGNGSRRAPRPSSSTTTRAASRGRRTRCRRGVGGGTGRGGHAPGRPPEPRVRISASGGKPLPEGLPGAPTTEPPDPDDPTRPLVLTVDAARSDALLGALLAASWHFHHLGTEEGVRV